MSRSPRSDEPSLPQDPSDHGIATPEPSTAPPLNRSPPPEPADIPFITMDALPTPPSNSFLTRRIPTVLEGPNYRAWREDAYETLRSQQLWLVISGEEKEPLESRYGAALYIFDQHSIAWKNKNLQASTLLYESLSDGMKARIKANDLKEKAKEAWDWLKKEYDAANHLYAVTAWSTFARTHFNGSTPQHWTEHMAVLEKNLTDFVKYVGDDKFTTATWKSLIFSAHLQATLSDSLRDKMKPYFSALQAMKSAQATLIDFTPEWISNTINTIMLEEGLSEVQKAQEQALITRSVTPARGSGKSGSTGDRDKSRRSGTNRPSSTINCFPPCPHCSLRSHTSDRCWELEGNRTLAPPGYRFKDGAVNPRRKDSAKELTSPSIDTSSTLDQVNLVLNTSDFSSDFASNVQSSSHFAIQDQVRLVEEVEASKANLSFDKTAIAIIDSGCTSHVFPLQPSRP
ncbi:hypothetical protein BT69DRAFT_1391147 [Atractiella rhizophila]|nr:hypothetical protein BT69DRAFT_1391147 [Atractiella rhizophila]